MNIFIIKPDLRKVDLLTEEGKKQRAACSKKLLGMFGPGGTKRLCDIVTGDETWICFYGNLNKRSNQMWVDEKEPESLVLRPGFSEKKAICSCFLFKPSGPVTVYILPEKTALTATYYTKTVLPEVIRYVHDQYTNAGTSKSILLHDHAGPHKAEFAESYLQEQDIHVFDRPPYGPDLAPCDFWLFFFLN